MIGLGTIINSGAIIVGGLLGLLVGKLLKPRFQAAVCVAMALCTIAMSVSSMVEKMLQVGSNATNVLIFALVPGALLGELLDIDKHTEDLGTWLREKSGSSGDGSFVDGFVTASLTVCIGAMAVVGSVMDGLRGDYSILLTKAILDFVIVLILTASKGKGCIFSAIPVFVLQGTITLLAKAVEPVLGELSISYLSMTGAVLILCVGINLLCDGKFRIKVANLLPAMIFAVIAAYVPFF